MKKLILALLAVSTITAANAQKNSILVFGTAGVSKDNIDRGSGLENETLSFNINPGVGYQFTNHWTAGVQGGYMKDKFTETQSFSFTTPPTTGSISLEQNTSEWAAGVFGRYTHCFNNTFSLFGQLNASYFSGNVSADTAAFDFTGNTAIGEITDEYNGFRVGVFPALAINVHNGLALNFSFGGINYETFEFDNGNRGLGHSGDRFAVTFGDQVNVGISKNFACKKKHHGHAEPGSDLRRSSDAYDDEDESPKKKKAAESDDDDE